MIDLPAIPQEKVSFGHPDWILVNNACMKKIPAELDRITDMVLAYKPKPKTKAAKKRTRKAKRERNNRV